MSPPLILLTDTLRLSTRAPAGHHPIISDLQRATPSEPSLASTRPLRASRWAGRRMPGADTRSVPWRRMEERSAAPILHRDSPSDEAAPPSPPPHLLCVLELRRTPLARSPMGSRSTRGQTAVRAMVAATSSSEEQQQDAAMRWWRAGGDDGLLLVLSSMFFLCSC